ncbi:MAG: hypothetical protein H6Q67_53 [Firmicutes bacterium]|nr:hypothetical protein [Bacillota bacterium]
MLNELMVNFLSEDVIDGSYNTIFHYSSFNCK